MGSYCHFTAEQLKHVANLKYLQVVVTKHVASGPHICPVGNVSAIPKCRRDVTETSGFLWGWQETYSREKDFLFVVSYIPEPKSSEAPELLKEKVQGSSIYGKYHIFFLCFVF